MGAGSHVLELLQPLILDPKAVEKGEGGEGGESLELLWGCTLDPGTAPLVEGFENGYFRELLHTFIRDRFRNFNG